MKMKPEEERITSSPLSSAWPALSSEDGVSALEYALIAALIALAIIIAVVALGGGVSDLYSNISTHVTSSS